ncbi:RNA-dependent RNA polymerase 6 [Tanacetum coccineum]
MGKFSNRNIAKCAAGMGQCFSSTYSTVEVLRHEVDLELKDIKRNSYVSHGMGKMLPELAVEVAEKLQLTDNQPCAIISDTQVVKVLSRGGLIKKGIVLSYL